MPTVSKSEFALSSLAGSPVEALGTNANLNLIYFNQLLAPSTNVYQLLAIPTRFYQLLHGTFLATSW